MVSQKWAGLFVNILFFIAALGVCRDQQTWVMLKRTNEHFRVIDTVVKLFFPGQIISQLGSKTMCNSTTGYPVFTTLRKLAA